MSNIINDIFFKHIIPILPTRTKYILYFTCKTYYNEIKHYKIYSNNNLEYYIAKYDNINLYKWYKNLDYKIYIDDIINYSLLIHKTINTNMFQIFDKKKISNSVLKSLIRYKYNDIVMEYINTCNNLSLIKMLKYSIKYNNDIIFRTMYTLVDNDIKSYISIKTVSGYCDNKDILVIYYSAGYNNEIVFFNFINDTFLDYMGIIHFAILGQNLNIIKYVFSNNFSHSPYLYNFVLSFGNNEVIQYIINLNQLTLNYECCIMMTKYNYKIINNIQSHTDDLFRLAYPHFSNKKYTKFYLNYYYPNSNALILFCQHVVHDEHIRYLKHINYPIHRDTYIILLMNKLKFFKLILDLFPINDTETQQYIINNIYKKNIKNNGDIIIYLLQEKKFNYNFPLRKIYKNTEYNWNTKQYIINNLLIKK